MAEKAPKTKDLGSRELRPSEYLHVPSAPLGGLSIPREVPPAVASWAINLRDYAMRLHREGYCIDCVLLRHRLEKHLVTECPGDPGLPGKLSRLGRAAREIVVQGLDEGAHAGMWVSHRYPKEHCLRKSVHVAIEELERLEAACVELRILEPWKGTVRREEG